MHFLQCILKVSSPRPVTKEAAFVKLVYWKTNFVHVTSEKTKQILKRHAMSHSRAVVFDFNTMTSSENSYYRNYKPENAVPNLILVLFIKLKCLIKYFTYTPKLDTEGTFHSFINKTVYV